MGYPRSFTMFNIRFMFWTVGGLISLTTAAAATVPLDNLSSSSSASASSLSPFSESAEQPPYPGQILKNSAPLLMNKFNDLDDGTFLIPNHFDLERPSKNNQFLRKFSDEFDGPIEKRNDDIPPGFIGVRGRRTKQRVGFWQRFPLWIQKNPWYQRSKPSLPPQSMINGLDYKLLTNQKKNNPSIYNDGFLGVRG